MDEIPEFALYPIPGLMCICDETTAPGDCLRCEHEKLDMSNEELGLLDEDQLSLAMHRLKDLTAQVGALQDVVVKTLIARAKSHKIPGMQAVYSPGRKSYRYDVAGKKIKASIIKKHTVKTVNWRAACEDAEIPKHDIPFTQSEPRVSFRLKADV